MDVSKNRGIPKWMVYNGKPVKLMIWGYPYVGNTHILNHILKVAEDAKKLVGSARACLCLGNRRSNFNGRITHSTVE